MARSQTPLKPTGGPNRSAIQFALLPLSTGVLIGIGIDYASWHRSASLPDCFLFFVMMAISFLYFTLAIIAVSAAADFLFRNSNTPNAPRFERRYSLTIALLGALYATMPLALAALVSRYWSANPAAEPTAALTKAFAIPFGLLLPLLLVTRRPNDHHPRRRHATLFVSTIVLWVAASLAIAKSGTNLQFHNRPRDYNAALTWVCSTHTNPGHYKNLTLPSSLAYLSDDGKVEALLLTDGRTVLLFESETPWISFCRYTLFASAPLTTYEAGIDHPDPWFTSHWGYPELRITGLPSFCIFSTQTPDTYEVGMNN